MGQVRSGQSGRALFLALASQHLKSLYHVVRHQIGYLRTVGDVLPDELTADEVVDAVLLRAYREFVKDPRERNVKSWLLGLAREHLKAEAQGLKAWRARTPVRTEQDFPDTPPTEWVSTLGDETLDFHKLDEDLKIEDVIPDIDVPTPEEQAETRELRWCIGAALAGMPAEWRRALLLRHVDGLAGVELDRALGRSQPETRRILEQARAYLRQKLVESGCRFKTADGKVRMSETLSIRCAACGATNRVPKEKIDAGLEPICGRCRAPLSLGGAPLTVTDATFATDVERSPLPVLLDAWAPWCGPCLVISPVVEQLAAEMAGRLRVGKLNVDENPSTTARYNIRSIPTLLVLNGGREVDRIVGVQPKSEIARRVHRAIA